MENETKVKISKKLQLLQYSPDVQNTWNSLGESVLEHARSKHQDRIDSNAQGSAFSDWWSSCVELLLPYQIVISDVNFYSVNDDKKVEEYIEIHNTGSAIVDLTGWNIHAENQCMVFVNEQLLLPNSKTRIYKDHITLKKVNKEKPLWDKKGDFVVLYNANGDLISSWRYGNKAHTSVSISYICFDGNEKYTEADEYVELLNSSNSLIDLSNWQLSAGKNQLFTFPNSVQLKPQSTIRIYTNHIDHCTGGLSFNSKTAIWNNKGDVGRLTDHLGVLVSEYRYGNKLMTND